MPPRRNQADDPERAAKQRRLRELLKNKASTRTRADSAYVANVPPLPMTSLLCNGKSVYLSEDKLNFTTDVKFERLSDEELKRSYRNFLRAYLKRYGHSNPTRPFKAITFRCDSNLYKPRSESGAGMLIFPLTSWENIEDMILNEFLQGIAALRTVNIYEAAYGSEQHWTPSGDASKIVDTRKRTPFQTFPEGAIIYVKMIRVDSPLHQGPRTVWTPLCIKKDDAPSSSQAGPSEQQASPKSPKSPKPSSSPSPPKQTSAEKSPKSPSRSAASTSARAPTPAPADANAAASRCCGYCGATKQRLKRCAGCDVRYCNAECQRKDWPLHKYKCDYRHRPMETVD